MAQNDARESTNRISLMAQNDAHDKMIKQAEQHREIMEKEFTQSLARMKAEHEKTINEAIKVRNDFAQLCTQKAEKWFGEGLGRKIRKQNKTNTPLDQDVSPIMFLASSSFQNT